jgi:hypothetical protein
MAPLSSGDVVRGLGFGGIVRGRPRFSQDQIRDGHPRRRVFCSPATKNKNAGLVGPAASLLLICGERLVYVSCPRGSF